MPTRQECEDEIIAASGGLLDRAAAARLMSRVEERAARMKIDPMEAARQIGDETTAASIIEKRNRLMNLRKRIVVQQGIEAKYGTLKERFGDEALEMALRSEVTGLNADVAGGKGDAVELIAAGAKQRYLGGAMQKLQHLGLWKAFRGSKAFQQDVGREMWEQSLASMGLPHRIGYTRSGMAIQAAEVLHEFQSLAKSDLNSEGAWIGDYPGYIAAQNQDGARVYKAGFAQWAADMMGWVDQGRTFEGVENYGLMLQRAWDNIFTGIHVGEGGGVGIKDPAFGGTGNLARQISQSRIFHFKDADSWMAMMDKYGRGSLPDQIFNGLRGAGDDFALLKRFGTNPEAEYQNHIRRTYENYRHVDPEAAKRLKDRQRRLMTEFGYVNGTLDTPVSEQWARIGQGMRNIESMAKLGFLPFTHGFSMGTVITKVKHDTDLPWMSVVGNMIASLGRGSGERVGRGDLHDELLAGLDGVRSQIASQWTLGEQMPGATSKALATMLRLSGFNYIINAFKAGAKDMAARNLGMQADRLFDELGPNTQRSLRRYGITPGDWDLLRNAPDHIEVEGRSYITPMAAFRADPENELFTYGMRRDLAMKLYTYFEDEANEGVVTPGAYEKALIYGRDQSGTRVGELRRMFGQFKTWGIAAVRQVGGRDIYGNTGAGSQIMAVASTAALLTILGYGRMATVAALKGQVPPSPLDPHTVAAALAQGGGFGIMADFLDAAVNRNMQSVGQTLAGPVLGTAWQALTLGMTMRDAAGGDRRARKDFGPEATRLALDNTPYINLWYTRMLLNYAFIWRLQEAMNPGFQRRYEQRMKKNGKQFFLSPAAAVH